MRRRELDVELARELLAALEGAYPKGRAPGAQALWARDESREVWQEDAVAGRRFGAREEALDRRRGGMAEDASSPADGGGRFFEEETAAGQRPVGELAAQSGGAPGWPSGAEKGRGAAVAAGEISRCFERDARRYG